MVSQSVRLTSLSSFSNSHQTMASRRDTCRTWWPYGHCPRQRWWQPSWSCQSGDVLGWCLSLVFRSKVSVDLFRWLWSVRACAIWAGLRVLTFSLAGAGYKVETGWCLAFSAKVVLKKTFTRHFTFLFSVLTNISTSDTNFMYVWPLKWDKFLDY